MLFDNVAAGLMVAVLKEAPTGMIARFVSRYPLVTTCVIRGNTKAITFAVTEAKR